MIDKLKEIKKYCDAATEGPWQCCNGYAREGALIEGISKQHKVDVIVEDGSYDYDCGVVKKSDSNFIAKSRTDLPKLLSALDRAVEALKWYEAGMPFDDSLGNEKQKAQEALKQIESILGGE